MQGVEMEDEGSVLKYMTKPEIEEQRSSLLIMTQRLFRKIAVGEGAPFFWGEEKLSRYKVRYDFKT